MNKYPPPRTLVIAPFVFNFESGSGVTLSNLFQGYPPERLANLHSSPQKPDHSVCRNFFRLSREELIRPRLFPGPEASSLGTNPTDPGQSWRSRARRWLAGNSGLPQSFRFSPRLQAWLGEFQPELIYTILGPIPYLEAVLKIREAYGAKLVVHCMDDWHRQAYTTGVFRYQRHHMRRLLAQILSSADECLAIGPEMALEFGKRYQRPFLPFQNAIHLERFRDEIQAHRPAPASGGELRTLLYYGSVLPFAQTDSLLFLARALEGTRWRPVVRTSAECAASLLSSFGGLKNAELQTYSGDPGDFPRHLACASALLLPANFDAASIEFLRYSMPTKVPGYMASGVPILYFGPSEIAQGQYAARAEWALCVNDRNEAALRAALAKLEGDPSLAAELTRRGIACARLGHDLKTVREEFQLLLAKAGRIPESGE